MDASHGVSADAEAPSSYPKCELCRAAMQRAMPDRPGVWVACFDIACAGFSVPVEITQQRDATDARERHSKEASDIAARALAMTLDDVPMIERVPVEDEPRYRAAVLASFQALASYMAEYGTTRWSESERKWADVLGVSRNAAMRHLVRMQAFGWIELDKRPITVERNGETRYVKPTVRRSDDGFATTTGGQTRVRLLPLDR